MKKKHFELLKKLPLFVGLEEERIREIIGTAQPCEFPRGKIIFQQGDPADWFYVILQGWVKVFRVSEEGNEAVLGVFSRGDTVADAAMFIGKRYPASAQIVAEAILLRIDGVRLRQSIHDDPEIAFSLLASMSHHMKNLTDQVAQMKLYHGPERVALFLLRLCPLPEGPAVISLPYEKSLVAARLGMQPESLSRALSKLRDIGVTVNQGHVVVNDVAKLAKYANADPVHTIKNGKGERA
ncbi:MAG TPA: Crp/Fnr family transcriptional regulator [Rhizobiales bacterium]|nr:Crp/Fnr family transcriptional regulator [Hyphomicrobiales bacterium]